MYLWKKCIRNYWVWSGSFYTQTVGILWQKWLTFHVTMYLLFFILEPVTFTWYPIYLVKKPSSLSLHPLLLILLQSMKSSPLHLFHNSLRLFSPPLPKSHSIFLLILVTFFVPLPYLPRPFLQCRLGTTISARHIQGTNWAHIYTVTYFLSLSK